MYSIFYQIFSYYYIILERFQSFSCIYFTYQYKQEGLIIGFNSYIYQFEVVWKFQLSLYKQLFIQKLYLSSLLEDAVFIQLFSHQNSYFIWFGFIQQQLIYYLYSGCGGQFIYSSFSYQYGQYNQFQLINCLYYYIPQQQNQSQKLVYYQGYQQFGK
ncbi:hypothetical protein IMG5_045940 [Ichthyophthirius multifiliis]|uniref:Uncharacterized protein n=1 Tax=Ichthyophthirius multifiliis TaxID=5932 RepID=G0QM76_ICHMU|nr:hypothetical protein IMG5_045940 [Ichthyophthirius multifiliis]EGR33679.1 hypothetical protein IMG5_045940 [Ichthyophthirius multifiliis]|eukprot:XP_004037665.1 hypothetical protein IMG5_045940 [Ichthyophthirius multifiliis]